MKETFISLAGMKDAIQRGKDNGCNELVISGGEPTIFPSVIIKLMTLAEELGYEKYIIQTNGSGLVDNDELLQFLDFIAQKKEVCISFSVHGHTSEIHDKMSGMLGAFSSLTKAIQNVSKTNCKIYTNTVISSLNVKYLANVARMILPYNPDIMQFSMMHLTNPSELSISLSDSVLAVHGLRNLVDLEILRTEGIPYCLMYGMEKCVGESCWPNRLDLYNREDSYMSDFKQLEYGMRRKLESCEKCILNKICMGVWSEHFDEFFTLGIHPII